jgi:hypothetical protein
VQSGTGEGTLAELSTGSIYYIWTLPIGQWSDGKAVSSQKTPRALPLQSVFSLKVAQISSRLRSAIAYLQHCILGTGADTK